MEIRARVLGLIFAFPMMIISALLFKYQYSSFWTTIQTTVISIIISHLISTLLQKRKGSRKKFILWEFKSKGECGEWWFWLNPGVHWKFWLAGGLIGLIGSANVTACLHLWEEKSLYLTLTIASWAMVTLVVFPFLLIADSLKIWRDYFPQMYESLPPRWSSTYFGVSIVSYYTLSESTGLFSMAYMIAFSQLWNAAYQAYFWWPEIFYLGAAGFCCMNFVFHLAMNSFQKAKAQEQEV